MLHALSQDESLNRDLLTPHLISHLGSHSSPQPHMSATSASWLWFEKDSKSWKQIENKSDVEKMEAEYQQHLRGVRHSYTNYHCFGGGQSAILDFEEMSTQCGSGKCPCSSDPDHMKFPLKRILSVPESMKK